MSTFFEDISNIRRFMQTPFFTELKNRETVEVTLCDTGETIVLNKRDIKLIMQRPSGFGEPIGETSKIYVKGKDEPYHVKHYFYYLCELVSG